MQYLDLSFPTPAHNLAFDEELLDWHEENGGEGVLRFWVPETTFVVVGYGNSIASEVHEDICRERNVPVLRRCSGGGTILQMPGCLNYTLVLKAEGGLASIPGANCHIMERMAEALSELLPKPISVQGHTDLVVDGKKFAGNSQRRKKHYLLFHGCFLLDADLDLIPQLLKHPTREPDYRQNRSHLDFLENLPVGAGDIKTALRKEWQATTEFRAVQKPSAGLLAKYLSNWHRM